MLASYYYLDFKQVNLNFNKNVFKKFESSSKSQSVIDLLISKVDNSTFSFNSFVMNCFHFKCNTILENVHDLTNLDSFFYLI